MFALFKLKNQLPAVRRALNALTARKLCGRIPNSGCLLSSSEKPAACCHRLPLPSPLLFSDSDTCLPFCPRLASPRLAPVSSPFLPLPRLPSSPASSLPISTPAFAPVFSDSFPAPIFSDSLPAPSSPLLPSPALSSPSSPAPTPTVFSYSLAPVFSGLFSLPPLPSPLPPLPSSATPTPTVFSPLLRLRHPPSSPVYSDSLLSPPLSLLFSRLLTTKRSRSTPSSRLSGLSSSAPRPQFFCSTFIFSI